VRSIEPDGKFAAVELGARDCGAIPFQQPGQLRTVFQLIDIGNGWC
jgi:hypothetical protein